MKIKKFAPPIIVDLGVQRKPSIGSPSFLGVLITVTFVPVHFRTVYPLPFWTLKRLFRIQNWPFRTPKRTFRIPKVTAVSDSERAVSDSETAVSDAETAASDFGSGARQCKVGLRWGKMGQGRARWDKAGQGGASRGGHLIFVLSYP